MTIRTCHCEPNRVRRSNPLSNNKGFHAVCRRQTPCMLTPCYQKKTKKEEGKYLYSLSSSKEGFSHIAILSQIATMPYCLN